MFIFNSKNKMYHKKKDMILSHPISSISTLFILTALLGDAASGKIIFAFQWQYRNHTITIIVIRRLILYGWNTTGNWSIQASTNKILQSL